MSGIPEGPAAPSGSASEPTGARLSGKHVTLVPFEASHEATLWEHLGGEDRANLWKYMLSGPYTTKENWAASVATWANPPAGTFAYTVLSKDNEPVGMMSYLNIVPDQRRVEIGSVILSERLKRSSAATEAFYLIIKHAVEDLGYFRVEWKANNHNKPSLSAAARLGFVFEGIFRKHMIIKGKHRDTAWFSITDDEWPVVKQAFDAWLSESNFDGNGKQIRGLQDIRAGLLQGKE